ncbi:MAG: copper chaperone PCu(A)C [Alphaproteobacteria bacterium]
MQKLYTFLVAVILMLPAVNAEGISVVKPWIRASNMKNSAAFMKIHSDKSTDDKLVAVELTDKTLCDRTELHTHIHEGDVKRMRKVEAIPVAQNSDAFLQPGGDHIMFMDLNREIKPDEEITMTFVFQSGDRITQDVKVKPVSYTGCKCNRKKTA